VAEKLRVVINPSGGYSFVYSDSLAPLVRHGKVTRASHVEPHEGGGWTADMRPMGGPVLGPFPLRSDALTAERDWLSSTWGI
jgi:hypothetical protein